MAATSADIAPYNQEQGPGNMSAVMSWPSFSMNAAIQPQLLRLEDSFEEAHRAGVTVQEEVKVAVVLKCISGQLRTHVSLQLAEGMGYKEL